MLAPRLASNGSTSADLCARRLSRTTMSPWRNLGQSCLRTQATKRWVFMAFHAVLNVTHPSKRMAPVMVRFLPQFMGRGSANSSPRRIHAWERPIDKLAPDSSTNTSLSASIRFIQRMKALRFWATSGRSCSAGRRRFF